MIFPKGTELVPGKPEGSPSILIPKSRLRKKPPCFQGSRVLRQSLSLRPNRGSCFGSMVGPGALEVPSTLECVIR